MSSQHIAIQRPSWKEEHLALLCGIANAGGGTLTVESSGMRKMQRILNSIPSVTQNALGISCTTEPVMIGRNLYLEINVPAAHLEPVSYDGVYYLYKNDRNTVSSRAEIEKLMVSSNEVPWELRIQPMARLSDVEPYMLDWLVRGLDREIGEHGGLSEIEIEKLLKEADLKDPRSDALTNAGVLLLHRTPERFIPGAFIRIGLFEENDFRMRKQAEINGPLIDQLEGAVNALFENFLPELTNQPTIPTLAITEAIRNALIHKDYESGGPISISIFSDKIIVSNIGRPPQTWTVSEFTSRHSSRPSNPVLASALQRSRAFDGWGNGVLTMIQSWEKAGLPSPMFELRADETLIEFPLVPAALGSEAAREASEKAGAIAEPVNPAASIENSAETAIENPGADQAIEQDGGVPEASPENQPEGEAENEPADQPKFLRPASTARNSTFNQKSIAAINDLDLTGTDEFIIKVLTADGRATAVNIAEFLNVSESTVRRSFRKLKDLGMITRVGSAKAGYWKVLF